MTPEGDPMSEAARALLDAERLRPEPSAARLEQIASRLDVSFGALEQLAPGPGAPSGHALRVPGRRWGLVAASFAAGAFVGVAATRLLFAPSPPASREAPEIEVPAPKPPEELRSPVPESARAEIPAPKAPPVARQLPPVAAPRAVAADADRDHELARERALLEIARSALGRDKAGDALEAIEQHAGRYPRGVLSEERESLRIQALVSAGRTEESRAAAAAFQDRFPRSILWPAIRAALEREP